MKVAAVLAAIVVLIGCSRVTGPVEIPRNELPFSVTRTAGPEGTARPAQVFDLYFVRGRALVERRRPLERGARPALTVLRALLDGPSAAESRLGISSQVPREVRVLDAVVLGSIARVDLSGEFQQPAPPERIALRVAQVVWTLTALPGVGAVSFYIDGEPTDVTTGEGTGAERRVTRDDFRRFAPGTG